LLISFKCSTIP